MNRREFVSTLAAGTIPFLDDEWRSQLWRATGQPSSRGQTSLRDFVVPEAALDDAYVPAGTERSKNRTEGGVPPDEPRLRQRTVTRRAGWENERSQGFPHEVASDDEGPRLLQYDLASKEYVIPIETEDLEMDSKTSLVTKAGKPVSGDEVTTTPADLHRHWYHEWWGADAEPITDYATEWVDIRTEERDEPHEWSEYFVRQPVMYLDPELMAAAGSRRPYYEETLIIATTDWGVLSLRSQMLHFSDGNETLDTVRTLAEELYSQAQDAPTPTVDREVQ